MDNKNNAVEAKNQSAATDQGANAQPTPAEKEVDYEQVLTAARERTRALEDQVANLRVGILKAKGKLPTDEEDNLDPKQLDVLVEQKVKEALLSQELEKARTYESSEVSRLAKRTKELELALKNRPHVSPTAVGSHSEGPIVSGSYSKEEQDMFKAKGWDDKKIQAYKKNLARKSNLPS